MPLQNLWRKDPSAFVAILALVVSLSSGAFAFFQDRADDQFAQRAEIRSLLLNIIDMEPQAQSEDRDIQFAGETKISILLDAVDRAETAYRGGLSVEEYMTLAEFHAIYGFAEKAFYYNDKAVDASTPGPDRAYVLSMTAITREGYGDLQTASRLLYRALGEVSSPQDDEQFNERARAALILAEVSLALGNRAEAQANRETAAQAIPQISDRGWRERREAGLVELDQLLD